MPKQKDADNSNAGLQLVTSDGTVTRVTFLEMETRPTRSIPLPTRPRVALMTAKNIPLDFYRYLYHQVGSNYHWYIRNTLSDDALSAIVHNENTFIQVLYVDGCPGGFFELNLVEMPDRLEIAYFGLAKDFVGMGLGKWFLHSAIDAAWSFEPKLVHLHTCTIDHPAALPLYQKMGFTPVRIGEEIIPDWA